MNGADTQTEIMDRLAGAAWTHLAETPPRQLHIDDIAAAAGIPTAAARAVTGSITTLILHRLATLDRQAVLESLADIQGKNQNLQMFSCRPSFLFPITRKDAASLRTACENKAGARLAALVAGHINKSRLSPAFWQKVSSALTSR